MSILVLEERKYPSAKGYNDVEVPHHKPIVDGIRFVGKNVFEFKYAVEEVIKINDFDSVSESEFKAAIDIERVFDIIQPHDIIILMGSRLCEFVLDKKLSKVNGIPQKVGNKIIIPTYSSFYCHKNQKTVSDKFQLAYRYYIGDIVEKDAALYEIITDLNRLKEVASYRHITNIVAFDFETSSLHWYKKEEFATILSLSFQPGYSYIIPFKHYEWIYYDNEFNEMLKVVQEILGDPKVIKVAHNLTFDRHWLLKYGIHLVPRFVDTMLMSHICNENRRNHKLKDLTKEFFPFWAHYEDDVDYNGPLEQLSEYAAIDTDVTLRLFYIFENELLKDGHEDLYRLMRNLVMPALPVLGDMSNRGCKIDRELIIKSVEKAEILLAKKKKELDNYSENRNYVKRINIEKCAEAIKNLDEKIRKRKLKSEQKKTDKLQKLDKKLSELFSKGYSADDAKMKTIQRQIVETRQKSTSDSFTEKWENEIREIKTGQNVQYTEVNYNSPDQLCGLLYDGFNFNVPIVNRKPKRTSARDAINSINHPFINTLFAYRTISKMISTYYLGILNKLDENDFLHGSFLLHGTVTGRLSSRGPNLQNMPSRLGYEDADAEWVLKQVKKFFIPPSKDYYTVQVDYSQAELIMIANVSGDEVMRDAYRNNEDLHAKTGAVIRQLPLEEFMKLPKPEYKKFRTHGKPANFGWVYKASIDGYIEFAKNQYGVNLNREEAQRHKDAIFKTYPKIAVWHARQENKAKMDGYVTTMFGRRRRLLNINNTTNESLINKDIRDSINNPIQGSAGEFTIFCLTLLSHRLPKEAMLWSTVHDSKFLYIHKDYLWVLEIVNQTSENPPIFQYFDIKPEDYPIGMKLDYEISDKSWGDMEEIGRYNVVKQLVDDLS